MTKFRLAMLALLAILVSAPMTVQAAPAANWVDQITMTPAGGHVLGNPAAPNKLVEYISYTCPHCAHFVGEASEPLKANYVRTGKVSVEVRNAVRDKYDLTVALLARCGDPKRFFGNHEALFANQGAWMEKVIAYDKDATKPTEQKAALRDIGQKTGLYAFMAKRGYKPAQLDSCINDANAMKQIAAMTDEAWNKVRISGTPGFTLNGMLVNGSDWLHVQAALPDVSQ